MVHIKVLIKSTHTDCRYLQ